MKKKQASSIQRFYRYYLKEHSNRNCRRMHFFGNTLVLGTLLWINLTQNWVWLLIVPVCGYGPAWFGHFVFEKNRPATFKYPMFSLICDWIMYKDMLTGKIKF